MAESNPKQRNPFIPIPAGDDDAYQKINLPASKAKNVGVPSAASDPDAGDSDSSYLHLDSLAKNAPVPAGDDDNEDLSMESNGGRGPQDSYKSGNLDNPLW